MAFKYLILIKAAINVGMCLYLAKISRWPLAMMFSGFAVADIGSLLAI